MRTIKFIAIHCTAGHTLIPAIENFWYNTLKWKSPGYHIIVYPDGTLWYVTKNKSYSNDPKRFDMNIVTNGIAGFNSSCLHVSYVGGVEKTNVFKAADTRTPEQKSAIIEAIKFLQKEIEVAGQNPANVKIQGHRDFSPDKNGNGVVDSWERIKECPSFDAIPEYKYLIPITISNMKYTISNLNIRQGAGTNFKTISNPIPQGEQVVVIHNHPNGWSEVIVKKTGTRGFVSTKYLR